MRASNKFVDARRRSIGTSARSASRAGPGQWLSRRAQGTVFLRQNSAICKDVEYSITILWGNNNDTDLVDFTLRASA